MRRWLVWHALWWAWPRLTLEQQARVLVVVLTMEKRHALLAELGLTGKEASRSDEGKVVY
jgi:hypothetical protein